MSLLCSNASNTPTGFELCFKFLSIPRPFVKGPGLSPHPTFKSHSGSSLRTHAFLYLSSLCSAYSRPPYPEPSSKVPQLGPKSPAPPPSPPTPRTPAPPRPRLEQREQGPRLARQVPREGGARTKTSEPPVHRVTSPEACARGQTGSLRAASRDEPQRPSGRGASRLRALDPVGLVPRPDRVGGSRRVRLGLTLALLTKRTSTATPALPATPTQKENTSHMEAAILGAPPPSDP